MSDEKKNQPEDFGLEISDTAEIVILKERAELVLYIGESGYFCLSQVSAAGSQSVHFHPEHVARICAALEKMKAEMEILDD